MNEEEFERLIEAEAQRMRCQRMKVRQLAASDMCDFAHSCDIYRRRYRALHSAASCIFLAAVLATSLTVIEKPAYAGSAGTLSAEEAIAIIDNTHNP